MPTTSFPKPWLTLYNGRPESLSPGPTDMLSIFERTVSIAGSSAAITYFGSRLSYSWLNERSDSVAAWMRSNTSVVRGSRLALILQNVPEFAIAVVAAWKLGAIPVPLNPMYRGREMSRLFADSSPGAIVCHDQQLAEVQLGLELCGREATPIIVCSPDDLKEHPSVPQESRSIKYPRFSQLMNKARSLQGITIKPARDDTGLLLYTSGTTGAPKGAMLSHGALAFNARSCREWFKIRGAARILAIAPLFHIVGFECQMCSAFLEGGDIILDYRFDAKSLLQLMTRYQPTFMIGAITAYIALMNRTEATAEHFKSFEALYSGGAPVPEAVMREFKRRFGCSIATAYGMTETTAPTHVTPYEQVPPVDQASGAVSIGIPISDVDAIIDGGFGKPAAPGELGELLLRGPMVMSAYYNQPAATAETLREGWVHTGDMAFMDANGWFYLVDRLKDVIIASGFKVWPREVEDVLYKHPAVREAAVVGVPDPYRGENVVACVSLRTDSSANRDELLILCREQLASFKVPCRIEFLLDLPKTASGKIMRAALRQQVDGENLPPAKGAAT